MPRALTEAAVADQHRPAAGVRSPAVADMVAAGAAIVAVAAAIVAAGVMAAEVTAGGKIRCQVPGVRCQEPDAAWR